MSIQQKLANLNVSNQRLLQSVLMLFIFGLIFPSIRVLLIGSAGSDSVFEYFISALPELLLFILLVFFGIRIVVQPPKIKLSKTDKALLVYLTFSVLFGGFIAGDLKISSYGFRLTYLPITFYFLFRFLPFEKEELNGLVNKIFKCFVWVGVLGIILYFFFFHFMEEMILHTGNLVTKYFITRMTSILWTPVVFGTMMSFTFIYFYSKLYLKNAPKLNYLYLSIAALCVLFSVSRGPVLIMILGLFVLPVYFKNWKIFAIVFPIVALQYSGLGFYVQALSPELESFYMWSLQSYSDIATMQDGVTRIELWKLAFSEFQERPFGYGLGNSGHIATRFYGEHTDMASVNSTDGWFLKLANETGIIGLITYFAFAGVYVSTSRKRLRTKPSFLVGFALLMFMLVNLQNLVSNVLDFYLFSSLIWLLLGISENIKSTSIEN